MNYVSFIICIFVFPEINSYFVFKVAQFSIHLLLILPIYSNGSYYRLSYRVKHIREFMISMFSWRCSSWSLLYFCASNLDALFPKLATQLLTRDFPSKPSGSWNSSNLKKNSKQIKISQEKQCLALALDASYSSSQDSEFQPPSVVLHSVLYRRDPSACYWPGLQELLRIMRTHEETSRGRHMVCSLQNSWENKRMGDNNPKPLIFPQPKTITTNIFVYFPFILF